MDKKYKCEIDNRWDWSIESASLTIHSPAGGYVRIDKWQLDEMIPNELRHLVWRIASAGTHIELTVRQMNMLTTYPKASVYKKRK